MEGERNGREVEKQRYWRKVMGGAEERGVHSAFLPRLGRNWGIWYRRLEAGTFQFPFSETGRKEVAAWELALLLEGIDLKKGRRGKGYRLVR
jgi:hypothetical protein